MSEENPVYTTVGSSEKLAEAWQRTYQLSLGEKVIRLRQTLGGMPEGDPLQSSWLPLDEMLDMAIGDAQRLTAVHGKALATARLALVSWMALVKHHDGCDYCEISTECAEGVALARDANRTADAVFGRTDGE